MYLVYMYGVCMGVCMGVGMGVGIGYVFGVYVWCMHV